MTDGSAVRGASGDHDHDHDGADAVPAGHDEGHTAVLAHVVLQHLSVVSAAIALLSDDDPGRARPPAERLLEQASSHTAAAVELLRDLVRGVPPEALSLEVPPPERA